MGSHVGGTVAQAPANPIPRTIGSMTDAATASSLLRTVGLLPDGPIPWGRPLPTTGPGVFLIELASPIPSAPIELNRIGKWLEHVPDLLLDGEHRPSRAVATRLGEFWLPSRPVLYIGGSTTSVSRRVAAIQATELGERRPASAGYWLHTLRMPAGARVWWAATTAIEEYEDALFAAFAEGVPATERDALPDPVVVLPFANLMRPTGERKHTGLTGALVPEPVVTPPPPTRIVQLPDGDAEGANGEPPAPRRRAPRATTVTAATRTTKSTPARTAATAGTVPAPVEPPDAGSLTVEGAARLRAELDELTKVKRPEVIARIRAAKELGDLKENADYTASREEQSFLEGRVQAIEARLRTATIVEAPAAGGRVGLGSAVTVEIDDDTMVLTIVGSSESDPKTGRISSSSPVGRALLGRAVGDDVAVATPAGENRYRIVAVD